VGPDRGRNSRGVPPGRGGKLTILARAAAINELNPVDTPRLSVIIVNHNAGPLIVACVESIIPQLGHDDAILIVDNGSTDGSDRRIEAAHAQLQLMRCGHNIGFAAGVNAGLRATTGEYVLLLNPDTSLASGALDIAIRYMATHPDVGILGGRILLPNGRVDPAAHRSFKTAGTYFYRLTGLAKLFPRNERFGAYYMGNLDELAIADVDSVVGAFMMVRRSLIDRIGFLDESFFMYCEDEDWCWRAKQQGSRVVYNPNVVVHHVKGTAARQRRLRSLYHWHRSLALYHRKNIAGRYPLALNVAIYAGIGAGFVAAVLGHAARRLFTSGWWQ
jgi:GT2 family glycosyltransferase